MVSPVTTSATPLATFGFNGRKLDRCQDGTLWALSRGSTTDPDLIYTSYSKDNGATWTRVLVSLPGVTPTFASHGALFIDMDDYSHLVWRQRNTVGGLVADRLYYSRGTPNAARTAWTWSAALEVSGDGLTVYNFPDVVAHREGTGWRAHIAFSSLDGTPNRALYARIGITSAGVLSRDLVQAIGGSYAAAAHTYPSIDFHHTGDGKTVADGTPHLYIGWTAGATGAGKGVRFRKAVYSGGTWTFNTEREIDSTRGAASNNSWHVTAFDGTRAVLVGTYIDAGNGADLVIYDRDANDPATGGTTTRPLVDNQAAASALLYGSASYDTAGNVYLFGRDATGASGTQKVNYRKWTRATATLGPIVTIDATGNDAPHMSAKRGSQPGNAIEVVYTDGTASPFTVQYDRTVPDVNALTPYVPAIML